MELDKRIKSLKSIRSFNTDNSDCSGKFGYFTNFIDNFDNLDDICKGTCVFEEGGSFPFYAIKTDSLENRKFQFFIPEEDLLPKPKEKKYRPYTFKEFKGLFSIGQPIKYRRKGNAGLENEIVLDGYSHEQRGDQIFTYIYIGVEEYTLQELFEDYEWQDPDTGEWDIFGVKE